MPDRLDRWRLILGRTADAEQEMELPPTLQGMDDVLEALIAASRFVKQVKAPGGDEFEKSFRR